MGRRFSVMYEVANKDEYVGNATKDDTNYRCDYSACGLCINLETICKQDSIITKFMLENTPEAEHNSILRGYF